MKKKILITGANGLLGQKLVYALKNREDLVVIATARGENRLANTQGYEFVSMNIEKQKEVEDTLMKYSPDTIIHCAAMTNVDVCEQKKEECWAANVTAVQNICEAAEKVKAHLIHVSTDFIFDGKNGPYKEDAQPNPVSYYGESKLAAEKIVEKYKGKWAILRTVLVYGLVDNMSRSNIVLWAKGGLEKGKTIKVVNDQFRTPTLAEDLAQGCVLVMDTKAQGIYNISGKDYMSILELVHKVADYYHLDKSLIQPISSSSLNQPAMRPPITGFIINKAIKDLNYQPHSFEEGIKILEEQLKNFKL